MSSMHDRFAEWLAAGAHDDPPRDAAVHAFVCEDCQRQMAAIDSLGFIDPGLASMPPSRGAASERASRSASGGHLPVARLAGSAAIIILLAVGISYGVSRLLGATPASAALGPGQAPVQVVLGGHGTPAPSSAAPAVASSSATPLDSASPATHAGSEPPRPTASARTAPTTRPTAGAPSAAATANPSRSVAGTPSQTPTARPTPSPLPSATPSATPSASPSATPSGSPTPAPTTPPPTSTPTSSPAVTSTPAASPTPNGSLDARRV